ncbi:MAG: hypothetical protein COW02_11805 [Comamonadaceae bacterium CG12_big_fil_rev_8_21_14_0_65_59_15]|nr:MAG: hypothetical protein COW02_11805 [Comamonadaceae bacterium CG12_big_fil_rev_8_21_14_0_65_59_15]
MRIPPIHFPREKSKNAASFWRSRYAIGLLVMTGLASYFLLTEHLVHTLSALPYLLLAACPLMHIFMHHDHGGHNHAASSTSATTPAEPL